MPPPHADRNLLFGILALQMDFITRDGLVKAMSAWVLEKGVPLSQHLMAQAGLLPQRHDLLEAMVAEHLRAHGDDVQQSLAAVSVAREVRNVLESIADGEVRASLMHLTQQTPADPDATSDHVAPPPSPGTRFEVLRPHARGGLGEVFVARDIEVGREVALKEIQSRYADHEDSRARFLLEAKVTGALEHPGIVPVYGVGSYPDGRPFYAMRFIKGESLKDAIAAFHRADQAGQSASARSLALRQLLGRFVGMCQAVAYAHSRGVLHRDLKPANVMLGKFGETLVVDWGLAKVLGHGDTEASEGAVRTEGAELTQAGKALGTPAYMCPEQAAGRLERVGPRSDVYSLGATLYHLLTGQAPFQEADVGAILARVQKGDFPPPRQVNARVPVALEAVCRQAMALRPEERYATVDELAREIEHWLADEPVRAYREPWHRRLARRARQRPALVTGTAALGVTALAAVAIGAVLIGQEKQAKLEQQRRAREAQVASLLDVAPQAVPTILEGLAPYRDEVRPLLRAAAEVPQPAGATPEALALWRQHRARAALALLPEDERQVKPLAERLLEPGLAPDEMLLVRDGLRPHGGALKADLWRRAGAGAEDGRFRALVALAAYDADSPRWDQLAAGAVGQMLRANPLHLGQWVEALRPVRQRLLPTLGRVFRGEDKALAEYRKAAANVLADYLSDQPEQLAGWLMEAGPDQFAILFEPLVSHRERAIALLTRETARAAPAQASEETREALARRQANAALALLKLKQDKPVWPLLRHSQYPEARSRLLALMALGGVPAETVVDRIEVETDLSARRALILALGEFTPEQVPAALRERISTRLVQWYRDDRDSGIHGAIDWLLRHADEGPEKRKLNWGRRADLERIDATLAARARRQALARAATSVGLAAGGALLLVGPSLAQAGPGPSGWYVNGQGDTLVLVDGRDPFLMGSPQGELGRTNFENQHWRKIGRRFALASRPVTVAQFARFLKAHPEILHPPGNRQRPHPDCPMGTVTWYEAAAYCRWLSEQEGVPEHEMVYPPVSRILQSARDNKPLPLALSPGHLSRTGYRLPSEAEWELACRAGAATSRFYGSSLDLLPRYAWSQSNSNDRSWPVGQKRPNDRGLFDMHGNVWTWCQERFSEYPPGTRDRPASDFEDTGNIPSRVTGVARGGSFTSREHFVRCSRRSNYRPTIVIVNYGLRVCQTVP